MHDGNGRGKAESLNVPSNNFSHDNPFALSPNLFVFPLWTFFNPPSPPSECVWIYYPNLNIFISRLQPSRLSQRMWRLGRNLKNTSGHLFQLENFSRLASFPELLASVWYVNIHDTDTSCALVRNQTSWKFHAEKHCRNIFCRRRNLSSKFIALTASFKLFKVTGDAAGGLG